MFPSETSTLPLSAGLLEEILKTLPSPEVEYGNCRYLPYAISDAPTLATVQACLESKIIPFLEVQYSFNPVHRVFMAHADCNPPTSSLVSEGIAAALQQAQQRGQRVHRYVIDLAGFNHTFGFAEVQPILSVLQSKEYAPHCGELWLETHQGGPYRDMRCPGTELLINFDSVFLRNKQSIPAIFQDWFNGMKEKYGVSSEKVPSGIGS